MEKINFVNGQAPALNADTLNQMQTNIENAIPEIIDNLTTEDATKVLSANQGKILNEKINSSIKKYSCTVIGGEKREKGIMELTDSVSNYDEIRIWTSMNYYDHRLMCNTYKYRLDSDTYHIIQYLPDDYETYFKIYNNIVDTSECPNFGVDNRHIFRVEGIKYDS